jgi:predicted ATPase/DNA-binding SARP family transcriptional activator
MPPLAIRLLGPFQVTLNSQPITNFAYDKVRALLAYLAVEADHFHRRETLATLFWPDHSPKLARQNLRQSLATLRRAIKDRDASPPFLLVDGDTVQFNRSDNIWLDVAALCAHLKASEHTHPHPTLETCPHCIRHLEEAVALYRGDFLVDLLLGDSDAFETWAVTCRERLRTQALTALYHITRHYLRQGAYSQAQTYALRQVELAPYHEEAHRQLMRILARTGQRSAALAQYETCCRILTEELGVEPAQQTQALYERIRSAGKTSPHNLPPPLTSLIGREGDLQQLAERLATPNCRLLTLTGLGGIGKTRLALQTAQEHIGVFLHGVYFVPLAALSSDEFLASTIADALGLSFSGEKDPQTQLLNYLRAKEMLLVLDSFEHLLSSPDQERRGENLLLDILKVAPEVKIMVTSRERLNLQAEWVFEVRGLAFPKKILNEEIENYSAIQLFFRRARRVEREFSLSDATKTVVGRICQLVEGLPLGIELAAASVATLSCEQIATQIERNRDTLATTMRDVPARHRSIRAVFEHSWNLLTEDEQRVFRKLTVFRGGFETKAAQSVAEASFRILSALVDKSLIRRTPEERYEIHDLLRQYAAEKLHERPHEKEKTQERHCEYYAAFVQQKAEHLKEDQQKEALAKTSVEIENIRTAWQQAVAWGREGALEKFLIGLYRFYDMRSWFQEALAVFSEAATSLETSFGSADQITGRKAIILGNLLSRQGWFSYRLGFSEQAKAFLQKSLPILRRTDAQWELATALNELGIVNYRSGEHVRAKQLYQEGLAIARKLGHHRKLAIILNNLGNVCRALGEYAQAGEFLQENLEIMRALGDQFSSANSLNNLGEVYRAQGKYLEAKQYYQESLIIRREIGDQMGVAVSLNNLGGVAHTLGEYKKARSLLQESLEIFTELSTQRERAYPLSIMGRVARDLGDYREALTYYQEALKLCMEVLNVPKALDILAEIASLLAKARKKEKTVELLTLVIHHSATHKETRCEAEGTLSELEAELPPEVVAVARKRGQRRKLEDVVEEMLSQKEDILF